jgi:hypothetical protein
VERHAMDAARMRASLLVVALSITPKSSRGDSSRMLQAGRVFARSM